MQALLAAQPMTNWLIRGSINSLAPLIAAEYGFTDEQRAMLLAAFFPGCALLPRSCSPPLSSSPR